METKVNQAQNQAFNLDKTTVKMDLAHVFDPRVGSYNEFTMFIGHFNHIPNIILEGGIDCKRSIKWFADTYKDEIVESYFNKRTWDNNNRESKADDMIYFLYEDLLVYFDSNNLSVRFLFKQTEISKVEAIVIKVKKFRKAKAGPEISLLVNSHGQINTKELEISKPKLNIRDNYNDDFMEIHLTILKRVSKKKDKGLILLHGKPGTGKTSYIRYLIGSVKKKVIFLPPNMATVIADPNLISVLIENPDSIFVIEDAENIVVDREKDGNSPVSTLLNISDGLLSDYLNIQIICSFNTDEQVKTYTLDRFQDLDITKKRFAYHANLDPAEKFKTYPSLPIHPTTFNLVQGEILQFSCSLQWDIWCSDGATCCVYDQIGERFTLLI